MFYHAKELQFNARVSGPDPKFARLLLEQFGGPNGELKAAMQYFVQGFAARKPYPDKYDLLIDIAAEELSHLEIVGATITMLLDGINGELKDSADQSGLMELMNGNGKKEEMLHEVLMNPQFLVLSGGGPTVTDSNGNPWQGSFVEASGDLTVDLRSNIAAESRAKIVYEYLIQFTDDQYVKDTLRFLMTREISHMQMFGAALESIQPNFPPGVLQGDPRFTHLYFNMSDGAEVRGPWNQGQGPWRDGESWVYIDKPLAHVVETRGLVDQEIEGSSQTIEDVNRLNREMSDMRSQQVKQKSSGSGSQWSIYPQEEIEAPAGLEDMD